MEEMTVSEAPSILSTEGADSRSIAFPEGAPARDWITAFPPFSFRVTLDPAVASSDPCSPVSVAWIVEPLPSEVVSVRSPPIVAVTEEP